MCNMVDSRGYATSAACREQCVAAVLCAAINVVVRRVGEIVGRPGALGASAGGHGVKE
jgi:hypothetical protein